LVRTSPWSSGKCVRFGAGRSRVRHWTGTYPDLVNWYCSLLTRRTVCGRAAGNTPRPQKKPSGMKPEIAKTQLWRYKTIVVIKRKQPTTKSKCWCVPFRWDSNFLFGSVAVWSVGLRREKVLCSRLLSLVKELVKSICPR